MKMSKTMDLASTLADGAGVAAPVEDDTAELEVVMQDLGEALAKKDWAAAAAAFKAGNTICGDYKE